MPATESARPLPEWSSWIRFERVAPDRNRYREYSIAISRDLFGEWAVVRSWGRIGGQQRVKVTCLLQQHEATELAERIARRRLSRGYRVAAYE